MAENLGAGPRDAGLYSMVISLDSKGGRMIRLFMTLQKHPGAFKRSENKGFVQLSEKTSSKGSIRL